MWRVFHALGWVLAMGLLAWLLAMLAFGLCSHLLPAGDGPIAVAHGGGALLGVVAGLLVSRASWPRTRWHTAMAVAGAWTALIAGLVGGWFLLQAQEVARQPSPMLAGLGEFLVGLLAFAVAAAGFGLGVAGISGRLGHRAVDRA